MKKTAIFLLFLLANTVLLVHAVLPHHHHEEATVCYVATHCEDDDDTQEHRHHAAGHHHDDGAECIIKYDYARISSERSSEILNQFDLLYFVPIALFVENTIAKITDLESLSFDSKPYLFYSYKDFITHSLGLRAPPVC